jgi:hypothetical protein
MTASNSVAARRELCSLLRTVCSSVSLEAQPELWDLEPVGERLADGRVVDEPTPYPFDTINDSSKGELPCSKSVTGPNQYSDVLRSM